MAIGPISLDQKKDVPLYMRESSYRNMNAIEHVKLKGSPVRGSDRMTKNKSDYTQRGDK